MKIGDKAADFSLSDQNGQEVTLSQVLAQAESSVVLFFYPKDGTPICTMEACAFRDNHDEFARYGAKIYGISSDDAQSHRKFAEDNHLDFPLLWDRDGKLRQAWNVPSTMGIMPGRVTYVLDKVGIVRHIHSAQLQADKHVATALAAVKKLRET